MAERKPLVEHRCEQCSETFTSKRTRQRFCTYRCNKAWQSAKHWSGGYRPPPKHRVCAGCGVEFHVERNDGRYCSKRCAARTRFGVSAEEWEWRDAEAEAKKQAAIRRTAELRALRQAVRLARASRAPKRRRRSFVAGICTVCGLHYVRPRGQGSLPKSCGQKRCARLITQGTKALRLEQLRQQVFKRDDWTCGLCGEPVNPNEPWPSPRYPSIDHIQPRSRGGTDDIDNLQCAHVICNSLKGDSINVA